MKERISVKANKWKLASLVALSEATHGVPEAMAHIKAGAVKINGSTQYDNDNVDLSSPGSSVTISVGRLMFKDGDKEKQPVLDESRSWRTFKAIAEGA